MLAIRVTRVFYGLGGSEFWAKILDIEDIEDILVVLVRSHGNLANVLGHGELICCPIQRCNSWFSAFRVELVVFSYKNSLIFFCLYATWSAYNIECQGGWHNSLDKECPSKNVILLPECKNGKEF